MDFTVSPDHQAFADRFEDFCQRTIAPRAHFRRHFLHQPVI